VEATNPTTERVPLREVLTHRGYWRWSAAVQLLRLAAMMMPMAFILASYETTGGPGVGGLMIGAGTIVAEFSAPFSGRVIDRLGARRWAPRVLLIVAAGRLLLAGAFFLHLPAPVLVGIACVFAAIGSGASGATRTLLGETVPDRLLPSALALDSTVIEIVIICAPFVVAAAAVGGPALPLVVMAGAIVGGATLLGSGRPRRRGRAVPAGPGEDELDPADVQTRADESERERMTREVSAGTAPVAARRRSLWLNPAFLFWALVALAFGHLLGTAETGALPLADLLGGGNAQGAMLIAVLAAASAVAGLAYAWFQHRIPLSSTAQVAILLVVMVLSAVGIAAAREWVLCIVAFVVLGLCTAPINTVRSHAAGKVVHPGQTTEAFSIIESANSLGYALAGFLLAILSVRGMLLAGVIIPLLALVLIPVLLRDRTGPETPSTDDSDTEREAEPTLR
jgi:MFS family permease